MIITLSRIATIFTDTLEDFIYQALNWQEKKESDPLFNTSERSYLTASSDDDAKTYSATLALPIKLETDGLILDDSLFYLTNSGWTNGTGSFFDENWNYPKTIAQASIYAADLERELGTGVERFSWDVSRNPEKGTNNAIFNCRYELEFTMETAIVDDITIQYKKAKSFI